MRFASGTLHWRMRISLSFQRCSSGIEASKRRRCFGEPYLRMLP